MSYQLLAPYYDELMSHVPYDKWIQFTKNECHKHHIEGKKVIELGCGTGEIAIRLAEAGYHVSAIDLSEDMLTVAMAKAFDKQLDIQWVHQNITQLQGFSNIDIVVSYLDVMNYITNAIDLEKVCTNVYDSLRQGGIFLFDVHDEEFVEEERFDLTFVEHTENITYIWECEQNQRPGSVTHYLTFFIKQANGMFQRFTEIHDQQVLPLPYYDQLLKKVGFSKIFFYDDVSAEKDEFSSKNARNFIVAIK